MAQISPDGTQVAFTRVVVNESEGRLRDQPLAGAGRRIGGAAPADRPARTTAVRAGRRTASRLAFVRSAESDGKPQPPQIFLLAARRRRGAGRHGLPQAAPAARCGRRTARASPFQSTTTGRGLVATAPRQPEDRDVRVITERRVSRQRQRLERSRPSVACLGHDRWNRRPTSPRPQQLTTGKYSDSGPRVVARWLTHLLHVDRVDEPYFIQSDSDLYSVPPAAVTPARSPASTAPIGGPRPSPDGKSIAFDGTLYGTPRALLRSARSVRRTRGRFIGAPRNLTADLRLRHRRRRRRRSARAARRRRRRRDLVG